MSKIVRRTRRVKSNALARRRTELAFKRTMFAADRTLMAWVRTSLALISFGFTFVKFFQYLGKTSAQGKLPWTAHGPRNVGLLLVGLGTAMVLIAAIQNFRLRRQLQTHKKHKRLPGALIVAIAVSIIGFMAFIDLLFRSGFF